jgi:transcriptional regulator with XRE-family HTH domain
MTKQGTHKEYSDFAKKLKNARLSANLKQIDVAKKLKRPQSHISNIESGQQRVDVIELKIFAKLYRKPIGYFIN